MSLTKEQILKADDLKSEKIDIEQWGGSVFVRTMTGTERDSFEQSVLETKGKINLANIRARLCVLTVVDEKGDRLFSDGDGDIESLGKKSASALDKIFAVAQRLNGLAAKDVEELVKNSEIAQSGDSISV